MAAMHLPQRCAVLTSAVHAAGANRPGFLPAFCGARAVRPITPGERLHPSLGLWLQALPIFRRTFTMCGDDVTRAFAACPLSSGENRVWPEAAIGSVAALPTDSSLTTWTALGLHPHFSTAFEPRYSWLALKLERHYVRLRQRQSIAATPLSPSQKPSSGLIWLRDAT